MDNEVRIIMPVTSISKEQADVVKYCIGKMESYGLNIRTFNTKGDPCEPRMDFKANMIDVCDPETVCNPECQNLPDCKIKAQENQN